jgi:protein-arginine kinase activator protein McsA
MSMTSDEIKVLGDRIIDTLGALAFEIARRVMEVNARPEDWLDEDHRGRVVRTAAVFVLTDYFLGKFIPRTYVEADDGNSITCTRCGMTSFNTNDVAQKYCANCKKFHKRYVDSEIRRSP